MTTDNLDRDKVIVRTSIIGILVNILLVLIKAFIGFLSHSIAVILDAVNNLSDALSSVITIVGTKLAAKLPDKKHPLGYGRIEYLTAMIVSALVLYAGLTSLVESIKKIITPQKAEYTSVSLLIIALAVVIKLLLGLFVRSRGRKVNSTSLVASGSDALFDAILSSSVLLCAILYLVFSISLEAFVGVIIACFIIKSSLEMLIETLDEILGKRSDKELTQKVKATICEEPEVVGAYDLFLTNYGPDKIYASVHIQLNENMNVYQVDSLTRRIEAKVYTQTGVLLTGVGVYAFNAEGTEAANIRKNIESALKKYDWILQIHGFYVDIKNKSLRFDAVLSFDIERKKAVDILYNEVSALYPDYSLMIVPDIDISD